MVVLLGKTILRVYRPIAFENTKGFLRMWAIVTYSIMNKNWLEVCWLLCITNETNVRRLQVRLMWTLTELIQLY